MTEFMEVLEGTLTEVIFENGSSGFTVARFDPSTNGPPKIITVVGPLLANRPGERLRLTGRWSTHSKYGEQFEVIESEVLLPTRAPEIEKYLASGLFKGIGPALAKRIVGRFGDETLEMIEKHSDRLEEVQGIGPQRQQAIHGAWEKHQGRHELLLFLKAYDVGNAIAVKIYHAYGPDSLRVLNENPYQIAKEIAGVGFKTADAMALRLGFGQNSQERLLAALEFVLSEAASDGHVFLPAIELLRQCVKLLEYEAGEEPVHLVEVLERALEMGELRTEKESLPKQEYSYPVYLPSLYSIELGVARKLLAIQAAQIRITQDQIGSMLLELAHDESGVSFPYSTEQMGAILAAFTSKVMIMTGGPGTGKTTTIRGIIALMKRLHWRMALTAPTGRAAKRLSETTGEAAMTIHRLLKYSAGISFEHDEAAPLAVDAVIVDEMSMVNLPLMNHLLQAIPISAHLIFVGDVDQLPPIGPGNPLRDLIDSGKFHISRLTQIFRQAEESSIVTNAHRVNHGLYPIASPQPHGDFLFIEEERPEAIAQHVLSLVTQTLPETWGINPMEGIQTLSPMYRGPAGVDQLNHGLQERLNPQGEPLLPQLRDQFRIGDRVIQLRNNYEKEVFNGDLGRIADYDGEEQILWVHFQDRGLVSYEEGDSSELTLAYAITIHKSQGSEYPIVVIPLSPDHSMMMQRNLIYTAITRAKELVVLVGNPQMLRAALRNDRPQRRYSHLARRLNKTISS
ncbi:ATP-dependent RecD-like DNA helicase [Candidatus Acetothermia bacterium]|nr:ATP-dependent RecD-like DNA helicase [Candidatus Acetothermia bacterium]